MHIKKNRSKERYKQYKQVPVLLSSLFVCLRSVFLTTIPPLIWPIPAQVESSSKNIWKIMPFKKVGGKMSLEFEPSSPENKTCNWSTNTVLQFDWSGYHPISNEFLIMTTSSTFRNRASCFAVILYAILNFYGSFHTATDSQPTSYSQLNSAHICNRHGLLQELVFFFILSRLKRS